jgi:hypothetical protein
VTSTRGFFRFATVAVSAFAVALTLASAPAASAATAATPLADAPLPFTFATTGWDIVDLPEGVKPYQASTAPSLVDTKPHDANGVRKFIKNGVTYDHPQGQAALGLAMLDGYRVSKDKRYLTIALANANRLVATKVIDKTVISDGAWFYPYKFSFPLHGYVNETMTVPWYSGMAQGQALALFTRLAVVTGDDAWRTAADRTFASFLVGRRTGGPWVSEKDADGHLWLEEYAAPTGKPAPDRTFNGHNFAISGLYEYYELSKDPRDAKLLDGAMTATLAHLPQIRQLGWISHYCLAHPQILSTSYHAIHVRQMVWFHQFTHDTKFVRWADMMMTDYPAPALTGTLYLSKGAHTAYVFNSAGTILRSRTVTLTRSSSAPLDQRKKVYRRGGYYYEVTAGTFKGMLVKEVATSQYLRGARALIGYPATRTVAFAAGAKVSALGVNTSNDVDRSSTLTFTERTTMAINARGIVNGVDRVRIDGGEAANLWGPTTSVTLDAAP